MWHRTRGSHTVISRKIRKGKYKFLMKKKVVTSPNTERTRTCKRTDLLRIKKTWTSVEIENYGIRSNRIQNSRCLKTNPDTTCEITRGNPENCSAENER
jgi:hypothetical protein